MYGGVGRTVDTCIVKKMQFLLICRCKTELSVKAESLPKPAVSLPSITSYFHVIVLKVQMEMYNY